MSRPEWRSFHGRIKEDLLRAHVSGARLLDVGCGVGGDMWRWARVGVLSAVGLDPDARSVREASRRISKAGFADRFFAIHAPDTLAVLRALPGPFAAVTCMFSLQHVPPHQLEGVLKECARMLRPTRGALVLCIPDADALRRTTSKVVKYRNGHAEWYLQAPYFYRECAPPSERVIERDHLNRVLLGAGFERVEWRPFTECAGFEALSADDREISALYTAAVAYMDLTH